MPTINQWRKSCPEKKEVVQADELMEVDGLDPILNLKRNECHVRKKSGIKMYGIWKDAFDFDK